MNILDLMILDIHLDCDKCPSIAQLRHLSRRIEPQWKDVARCLRPTSFQSNDIACIVHDYAHRLTDQSGIMLERWLKEHGKRATIRLLCESLLDAKCRLHGEEVFGEEVVERVAREYSPNENGNC